MADNLPSVRQPLLFAKEGEYQQAINKAKAALSPDALLKRKLFAAHYIKSVNATASARFASFKSPACKGLSLLKEPFVKALLTKLIEDLDQEAIISRNDILMGLKREANDFKSGTGSSRVTAWTQLAKVYSMLVEKVEVTELLSGGVMLVPALPTPDAWEKAAAQQQQDLKEDVRK